MADWAASLAEVGRDVARAPGAGAAGGIGAALLACGARLSSGFSVLADLSGLTAAVEGADLVVTGEGSVDRQTAMGKAPAGVAALARSAGALVVALGGGVVRPAGDVFDAVFPIHGRPRPLVEALDPGVTSDELTATAAEVVRLVVRASSRRARAQPT
jgi:glycerate kinase